MGRYYPDNQSPDDTGNWDALNSDISQVRNVLLQQRIKQQDQKQKMKQIIQAALLKNMRLKQGADPNAIMGNDGNVNFSQFENTPKVLGKPQSTSISITQRPFAEMLKARDEVARTPDEWLKSGMATQEDIPNSGVFGTNFFNKKGPIQLRPEAAQIVDQARAILGNPNRVTKRISNAQGNILGGDTGGGIDVTDENSMPDASGYEEGTLVEDENGQKYKVVNGEWVSQ